MSLHGSLLIFPCRFTPRGTTFDCFHGIYRTTMSLERGHPCTTKYSRHRFIRKRSTEFENIAFDILLVFSCRFSHLWVEASVRKEPVYYLRRGCLLEDGCDGDKILEHGNYDGKILSKHLRNVISPPGSAHGARARVASN